MIKILIADDHAIVRQGLRQIIADTIDMTVTGEATNGQDVLDMIERQPFDIIVLDLSMPGRGGLETLKMIHSLYPNLPVLILSMHPEEQYAVRVLKDGASGYLTKDSAPEELVNAIRRIASGRKYITETLAERLAEDLEHPADEQIHSTLSDREFQVMQMLASGLSVSDIAERLSLSVKTVSTFRKRVLIKMQLKNNAELIHYVVTNHLID
jgi:two-component system, NarL family, invasion response regulator UvrY